MQVQGMAGAAEAELTALREEQEANAAEFEDLLSCLGQETAKVIFSLLELCDTLACNSSMMW